MAILNQEIKMNDPSLFRSIAYGYINPFDGWWVIHLAIFDFSLACEMLKSGSHAYHYPPKRSPRTVCTGGTTPAREGITMVFSTRRAKCFARNDQRGRDDEEGEPAEEGIQRGGPRRGGFPTRQALPTRRPSLRREWRRKIEPDAEKITIVIHDAAV